MEPISSDKETLELMKILTGDSNNNNNKNNPPADDDDSWLDDAVLPDSDSDLEELEEEAPDFGFDELDLSGKSSEQLEQDYNDILKFQQQKIHRSEIKNTNMLLRQRKVTQDGGVRKKIIKVGDRKGGHPQDGFEVYVHYEGRLKKNGFVFDASRSRGPEPFSFVIGRQEVIEGWDLAIKQMEKGEKALITVHPKYAYGREGLPPRIGANETLEFDIELVDWVEERDLSLEKNGSLRKKLVLAGSGFEKPVPDKLATINFAIFHDREREKMIEKKSDFSFLVDSDDSVIEGIHRAVKFMQRGEKAELACRWTYGYGKEGNPTLGVPRLTDLIIQIELISFESDVELSELSFTQLIDLATTKKEKANITFSKGLTEKALNQYQMILDGPIWQLQQTAKDSPHVKIPLDLKAQISELANLTLLNISNCFIKLDQWIKAEAACTKVLESDPSKIKAYYRRATARHKLKDIKGAKEDLKKVLQKEPNNAEARQLLESVSKKIEDFRNHEKTLAKVMIGDEKNAQRIKESKGQSPKPVPWIEQFISAIFEPGVTSNHLVVFNVITLLLIVVLVFTIVFGEETNPHMLVYLALAIGLIFGMQFFLGAVGEKKDDVGAKKQTATKEKKE